MVWVIGEDAPIGAFLMAEAPYLVALALIEQEGRRALPLAGRSLTAEAAAAAAAGAWLCSTSSNRKAQRLDMERPSSSERFRSV